MKPQIIDLDADRRPRRPRETGDIPTHEAVIIAFDPGGTTGWSLISVRKDSLIASNGISVLSSIRKWQHGQVDCGSTKGNLGNSLYAGISTHGESAGAATLARLCRAWPGAAIVVERFDLRQFSRDQNLLSPQRITSKLEQYLWLDGRDYFTQTPSEGKTTATDERLKNWGLYSSTGGMNHARDADRHAITFLRKAAAPGKEAVELRQAAWPHIFKPPVLKE